MKIVAADTTPTYREQVLRSTDAVQHGVLVPRLSVAFPCALLSYYSESEDKYTSIALCTDPAYWCVAIADTPCKVKIALEQKLRKLLNWFYDPPVSAKQMENLRLPPNLGTLVALPPKWENVLRHSPVDAYDWAAMVRYLNRPFTRFRIKTLGHDFAAFDLTINFTSRVVPTVTSQATPIARQSNEQDPATIRHTRPTPPVTAATALSSMPEPAPPPPIRMSDLIKE